MPIKFPLIYAAILATTLGGCKVQTESETVPEAEGSGRAVNIRVETMNREEVKDATSRAIDKTAEAAGQVKDAATGLAAEAGDLAGRTGTAIDNALPATSPATTPSAEVIATPAASVTE